MTIAIILFIIIIVVFIGTTHKKEKNKQNDRHSIQPIVANSYKSINFMSDNEIEFFNRLIKAFPECYVFPR